MKASTQDSPLNSARSILVWYSLHRPDIDDSVTLGSKVISVDGLSPAFKACPNPNIFQHYFGIEFHHEGHLCIWAISSYDFVHCFGFIDQITYCLSHPMYCLVWAMLKTDASSAILDLQNFFVSFYSKITLLFWHQ